MLGSEILFYNRLCFLEPVLETFEEIASCPLCPFGLWWLFPASSSVIFFTFGRGSLPLFLPPYLKLTYRPPNYLSKSLSYLHLLSPITAPSYRVATGLSFFLSFVWKAFHLDYLLSPHTINRLFLVKPD